MESKKFCFIICVNNPAFLEECIHYIRHLVIPDEYEIDLITIEGAESMTSGYQEAMEQSDAKYKIYLHQDVFILNRRFLEDILSIFLSDASIGMVGVVGYETMAEDGIMWHARRVGALYLREQEKSYMNYQTYRYSVSSDGYTSVAAVDGFLMATAYDIPWNVEELRAFDFYDAFQSMEFLKKGYKIVVPTQTNPWCLHDDGQVLELSHYDDYRQIFLKKYQDCLGKNYLQIMGIEDIEW